MTFLGMTIVAFLIAGVASPQPALPSCTSLVDDFCDELYAASHRGNWDLTAGGRTLKIRRGFSDNDFTEVARRSFELRLTQKDKLPKPLRDELEALGYFRELTTYVRMPALKDCTEEQLLRRRFLAGLLPVIWSTATGNVLARKTEQRHPGALKLRLGEWPPAWKVEETKDLHELRRVANRAIWEDAAEWLEAVRVFELIRTELKIWVKEQSGMTAVGLARAQKDLDAIRLFSPGTRGTPNESCAFNVENASYSALDNSIELCAGILWSPSLHELLAHEMAHALGTGRQRFLAEEALELGRALSAMRKTVCDGKPIQCEEWSKTKARLPELLAEWKYMAPEPTLILQCLQDKPLRPFESAPLPTQSSRRATGLVQSMASSSFFMYLTRPEAISRTGARHPNPAYLNPCLEPERFLEEPILNERMFGTLSFLAEYECAAKDAPGPRRLESAIQYVQNNAALFAERNLAADGPFSRDDWLNSESYAQFVDENFADLVATQVFSRILAKEPSVQARRNWALASIAGFCDEPGWAHDFPQEVAVQSRFTTRRHGLDFERRRRFFRGAASVLECEPDPSLKSCVDAGKR